MRALGERRVRHRLDEWLRDVWHPVLPTAELTGLTAIELAGSPVVLWPSGHGFVCAFVDRCPHRSVRLSAGELDGDLLRCVGHGWAWDATGRCAEVPGAAPLSVVGRAATRATLEAVAVRVAHGWIWCRRYDIASDPVRDRTHPADGPAVPDGIRWVSSGAWPVSAARAVELVADPVRWLGDTSGVVHTDGRTVRWRGPRGSVSIDLPVTATVERHGPGGARDPSGEVVWIHATPLSDDGCSVLCGVVRGDDATEAWAAAVVASMSRLANHLVVRDLPVVPGSEVSGPGDELSVAFRRALLDGP